MLARFRELRRIRCFTQQETLTGFFDEDCGGQEERTFEKANSTLDTSAQAFTVL